MSAAMFEKSVPGKIALARMRERECDGDNTVPRDFRFYSLGWVEKGKPSEWNTMCIKGAQFRAAKTGPRRGQLVMQIPGTVREFYISKSEIQAFEAAEKATKEAKQARAVAKGTLIPTRTVDGLTLGYFDDTRGFKYSISDQGPNNSMWLGSEENDSETAGMYLNQQTVKALIPLLEQFAKHGKLPTSED